MGRVSKYKKLDNADTVAIDKHDDGFKKVCKSRMFVCFFSFHFVIVLSQINFYHVNGNDIMIANHSAVLNKRILYVYNPFRTVSIAFDSTVV